MSTTPCANRLPTCIPVTYNDALGRHCLAYSRSPWNPARWLVVILGTPEVGDLECVHDDFGNLVPMRQRGVPSASLGAYLTWRPVQREQVAA